MSVCFITRRISSDYNTRSHVFASLLLYNHELSSNAGWGSLHSTLVCVITSHTLVFFLDSTTSTTTQATVHLSVGGAMADRAQHKHPCFHCQYNCVEFESVTAVTPASLESAARKSADGLVSITEFSFRCLAQQSFHRLCSKGVAGLSDNERTAQTQCSPS